MFGKNAQQSWHRAQLFDSGDVAYIALDDRLDIVEMPVPPAAPAGTGQCLGVAAREDGLHEAVADNRVSECRGLARERVVEKVGSHAAQFRLGQGQQTDDAHAARQRIRDAWQRHQVGGAGEQEPPGAWIGVDGSLDRHDQVRRALNLVDDRAVDAAHETDGIDQGGLEGGGVVQCYEGDGIASNPLRQRGLPRLPGAAYQNDPGVFQGLPDPAFDKARIHEAVLGR